MKYHHDIRARLEADGFMVALLQHDEIHTVAVMKGGRTHIVQAQCLDIAFLEISRSIEAVETLVD